MDNITYIQGILVQRVTILSNKVQHIIHQRVDINMGIEYIYYFDLSLNKHLNF